MIIKIPNPIKVGAYPFRVTYDARLPLRISGALGAMCTTTGEIALAKGLTTVQKCATFWHEVVHQISNTFDCHLDEDNTDRIAEGLTEVFLDSLGIEFDWSEVSEDNS